MYANRGFSWDWQGLFIGGMNFNNHNATGDQDIMTVGDWWLINSMLAMKFTPQLQARFIVDNVFNKQPPLNSIEGTGGNFTNATSQYFSGILGRALQVPRDYKFS